VVALAIVGESNKCQVYVLLQYKGGER
jgi:hypothetical protein